MLTTYAHELLLVARDRGRELREDASADRLRPPSGTRRALAASLRRAANRLDRALLAAQPA